MDFASSIRSSLANVLSQSQQQTTPQAVTPASTLPQIVSQPAATPTPKAEMFSGGAVGPLPAGLDPNQFMSNADGTISYKGSGVLKTPDGLGSIPAQAVNQLKIPAAYFSSGMYQKDMQQYGQMMGPGGIFGPNTNWEGADFKAPTTDNYQAELYTMGDNGPVGWSATEGARRKFIQSAYDSLLNGTSTTTDFSKFGQHPDLLGSDVMMGLANGGFWTPPGTDFSDAGRGIEARTDQQGNILVTDPRGGDGANPLYVYGPDGKFLRQEVGSKAQSPISGVASVALAALGMGAIGTATGAGGLGFAPEAGAGAGAGVSGLSSGADLDAFFGGLPGGAETLGQGLTAGELGGSAAGVAGSTLPTTGSTFFDNLIKQVGTKGISQLFSGSGTTSGGSGGSTGSGGFNLDSLGNTGLGNILGLIGGGIDASQQGDAANQMKAWLQQQQATMQGQTSSAQQQMLSFLDQMGTKVEGASQQASANTLNTLKQQQANIDGLYNPGTPEYNALWNEMSAKDAAAGRNSQYGPRSVDLAGKITGIKGGLDTQFATGTANTMANANSLTANNLSNFVTSTAPTRANILNQGADNTLRFTTGTSKALSDALNQNAARFSGLSAALSKMGQGSTVNDVVKALGGSGGLSSLFSGGANILNGTDLSGFTNQQFLDQIGPEGLPIDFGAGLADPTEDDVFDFINSWGF